MLVINGTETQITNSDLFKSVKTILSAEGMEKASAWVIAREYTNIIQNELYEDDFENEKDFAVSMGKSPALISQYKKACNFMDSIEENAYNLNVDTITVGKAYILAGVDNLAEFLDWCVAENICIESLSDKCLKDVLKQWKNTIDVEATTEEVTEVDNVEETEEDNDNLTAMELVESLLNDMSKEELEHVKKYIDVRLGA